MAGLADRGKKTTKNASQGAGLGYKVAGPAGGIIGGGVGGVYGYLTSPGVPSIADQRAAAYANLSNLDKQGTFDQNSQSMGELSASMDARRKSALSQSLGMFEPTDAIISRMYGPGAVGPGVDIDSLFGPDLYGPGTSVGGGPAYFDSPETQRQIDYNLKRSGLNKNDTFKKGTRGKRSQPRGYGV